MKIGAHFALLVAVSAAVIAPSLAQNDTVSSNSAVNLGMNMFLEFMNGEFAVRMHMHACMSCKLKF